MPHNPVQCPGPSEVVCAVGASGTGEACRAEDSHLGGERLLVSSVALHVRRRLLRGELRRREQGTPDGITVVIGHRDRADHRLAHALRSLRTQDYGGGDIHPVVVDYGSAPDQMAALREIRTESAVELIAASGGGEWSRGRCLNIGIKHATTRFLMASDVDVIPAGNYITEAVAVLREDPLAAVYSRCVYLPESTSAELKRAARERRPVDREALRSLGLERTRPEFSAGVVAAHTACFQGIRGYDEFYRGYGSEDSDLALRFLRLGLRLVPLQGRSFYLHQWHPRYEGVARVRIDEIVRRNSDCLDRTDSVTRNPSGWGEGRA